MAPQNAPHISRQLESVCHHFGHVAIYPIARDDPVALDRRQAAMQIWYHEFMRRNVLLLEDLLVTKLL